MVSSHRVSLIRMNSGKRVRITLVLNNRNNIENTVDQNIWHQKLSAAAIMISILYVRSYVRS